MSQNAPLWNWWIVRFVQQSVRVFAFKISASWSFPPMFVQVQIIYKYSRHITWTNDVPGHWPTYATPVLYVLMVTCRNWCNPHLHTKLMPGFSLLGVNFETGANCGMSHRYKHAIYHETKQVWLSPCLLWFDLFVCAYLDNVVAGRHIWSKSHRHCEIWVITHWTSDCHKWPFCQITWRVTSFPTRVCVFCALSHIAQALFL